MSKFNVTYQERYSRGELILRSIAGFIYITLPHSFILTFVGIWSQILSFISFWVILFTGRYPESFFEFQVKYLRWNWRVNARIYNLADGYPAFGLSATDEYSEFEVTYPEQLSRGHLLLKAFLGFLYCIIPHVFVLMFRMLLSLVLSFFAFWAVLFTGSYPKSWHEFNVGTMRWGTRLNLYLLYMTDDYPPFSGKPLAQEMNAQPTAD